MARPLKDGVDYFPKDVDFYRDNKIRLLRAEFGAKGMYLLDYILCEELYSKNGYFIKWDNDACFMVSDGAGCGCDPDFISEFISGCIRRSFFDKRVFDMFGVLTSAGIQRRYIRMIQSRDYIEIIKEYWLLDVDEKKDVPTSICDKLAFKKVSGKRNSFKSKRNHDKTTDNSQSKGKESKVNNRESRTRATTPTLDDVRDYAKENRLRISPEKFFYYYQAKNWKGISDWKAKAMEWEAREPEKTDTSNMAAYDLDEFERRLNQPD